RGGWTASAGGPRWGVAGGGGTAAEGRGAGFHSRPVPSPQPPASSLPSGLNATPYTPVLGPVPVWRVATRRPVAGFHSRTVPSPSPLASSVPPGLNPTS